MAREDDTKLRNKYKKCLKASKRILDSEVKNYSIDNLIQVANFLFHEGYGKRAESRYIDDDAK